MGLLNLWQEPKAQSSSSNDIPCQLLVIQFFYGIDNTQLLHQMEDELIAELAIKGIGEYHGYDLSVDMGEGYIFIIGENANLLFDAVKPILENYYFMNKAIATLRNGTYNDENAKERYVMINYARLSNN